MSIPVIVAGAGIGGLTAALALASKGFRVTVLERAERLAEVGAGLQLSPNASRILIALGLQHHLAGRVITPGGISVMSARAGREIGRIPLGAPAARRYGAPYWIVHRADLQAALLARVHDTPAITLRLGAAFAGVRDSTGGVVVDHHDNGALRQDEGVALIGADGVWSSVRGTVAPEAQARFSGRIAWRGTVETAHLPAGTGRDRVQLWLGPNAHLVAYPISGGERFNVVAIANGDWHGEGWDANAERNDIENEFRLARWPDAARALVGSVESWRRWALFAVDADGPWTRGRVALLGDAAHAMLPFVAQGAGMAIEDAAVLAACLGDGGDVAAALTRYASQRRARVARVQRTAWQTGRIYHLRGLMAQARDAAIGVIGGDRLLARQDWIYRWQAN
ncbi:FAD-dependent monooxygenase [Bradyrhizobium sp. U87765 SZCCT0131]|nr:MULTISPECIES: FAD-dependent monooxygenase [unclassified Bradyrhizobium]MBR1222925.1 FAD-dependent monooxygenase [Bradyrhizobium sp. U87765 SZCCT0131]MBR1262661.1 FAD-dependent monooxygenase [Bradyrhizobium sp. U87765 SZCCT0134]MBR1308867.1 FAD-dependent monooxygenase [Bradyrhizobium sp. U87765 SZCCT0110]MBR1318443.1 FAD-dependent monooxygenase [Bradyrhizobium sp. U87765 SZCCT0109]MBR1352147.1 FAD-dependent monooxygenase [Bradyrhizobium sp. U87765 SZCCT0048]